MAETDRASTSMRKPRIRILKSPVPGGFPGAKRYAVFMPHEERHFILDTNHLSILRSAIEWNSCHPLNEWMYGVYYG
jgi:hypothetical protein